MINGIVLFLLVFLGIGDIRKQNLSVYVLAAVFIVAAALRLFWIGDVVQGLVGSISGSMVYGISRISRGQIGSGDGFLLMATGFLLGFWENMELFLAGLFLCAFFSVGAIVLLRKGKKYRIPFVPFLAGAQLFRILVLL